MLKAVKDTLVDLVLNHHLKITGLPKGSRPLLEDHLSEVLANPDKLNLHTHVIDKLTKGKPPTDEIGGISDVVTQGFKCLPDAKLAMLAIRPNTLKALAEETTCQMAAVD